MKTEKPRTFSNGNQNGRQIHELHSSKERSLLGKTSKPYETFISKPETERIFQHKTTFVFHKKRKTEDNPFLLKKKTLYISEQTKIHFTPLQNRNAPHAYRRSVHISKQEQDESMFLLLTSVMFFVLLRDKGTFSVHDIRLI